MVFVYNVLRFDDLSEITLGFCSSYSTTKVPIVNGGIKRILRVNVYVHPKYPLRV